MARATELTHAEVFKVIEDLLGEGEYPTSARMRERLDNRGSPVVLQRFLGEWYADNGPLLAGARSQSPAVAAAVEDRGIRRRMRAVTEEALKLFEQELDRREASLEERIAAADGRDESLREREAHLDGRETEINRQLREAAGRESQLAQERDGARRQADDARAELAGVQGQLTAYRERIGALEAAQVDAAALERRLELSMQDASREASRVLELVGTRDQLQAALSLAGRERDIATGKLAAAEATLAEREQALALTRKEASEAGSLLAAGESMRESLAARARVLEEEVRGLVAARGEASGFTAAKTALDAQLEGVSRAIALLAERMPDPGAAAADLAGRLTPIEAGLAELVKLVGTLTSPTDEPPRGRRSPKEVGGSRGG